MGSIFPMTEIDEGINEIILHRGEKQAKFPGEFLAERKGVAVLSLVGKPRSYAWHAL